MNKVRYVIFTAAMLFVLINSQEIDSLLAGMSQIMPLNLPHKH